MIANRCMQDKVNGKTLRNELIKRMWEDVNNRLDKLYVSILFYQSILMHNLQIFFT
mgnify:CR=1 FL=1